MSDDEFKIECDYVHRGHIYRAICRWCDAESPSFYNPAHARLAGRDHVNYSCRKRARVRR